MIVGSPGQFVVDVGISGRDGNYVLGTISYLIGGRRVGDPELVTLLGDYAMQIPRALDFRGKRESEWLWQTPEAEAFRWLDERLYDYHGVDYPEEEVDAAARHNVTIGLDSLDAWKIYLVQQGDFEKLIFSERPYTEVFAQVQPTGSFDRAILETFELLNGILDDPA